MTSAVALASVSTVAAPRPSPPFGAVGIAQGEGAEFADVLAETSEFTAETGPAFALPLDCGQTCDPPAETMIETGAEPSAQPLTAPFPQTVLPGMPPVAVPVSTLPWTGDEAIRPTLIQPADQLLPSKATEIPSDSVLPVAAGTGLPGLPADATASAGRTETTSRASSVAVLQGPVAMSARPVAAQPAGASPPRQELRPIGTLSSRHPGPPHAPPPAPAPPPPPEDTVIHPSQPARTANLPEPLPSAVAVPVGPTVAGATSVRPPVTGTIQPGPSDRQIAARPVAPGSQTDIPAGFSADPVGIRDRFVADGTPPLSTPVVAAPRLSVLHHHTTIPPAREGATDRPLAVPDEDVGQGSGKGDPALAGERHAAAAPVAITGFAPSPVVKTGPTHLTNVTASLAAALPSGTAAPHIAVPARPSTPDTVADVLPLPEPENRGGSPLEASVQADLRHLASQGRVSTLAPRSPDVQPPTAGEPSRHPVAIKDERPIGNTANSPPTVAPSAARKDIASPVPVPLDQPNLPTGSVLAADDLIRRATQAYRTSGMTTDIQAAPRKPAPAKGDGLATVAVAMQPAPPDPEEADRPRTAEATPVQPSGAAALQAGPFPTHSAVPEVSGHLTSRSDRRAPPDPGHLPDRAADPGLVRTTAAPFADNSLGIAPKRGPYNPVAEPAGMSEPGPQGHGAGVVRTDPTEIHSTAAPGQRFDAAPAPADPAPDTHRPWAVLPDLAPVGAVDPTVWHGDGATTEFAPMPGTGAVPDQTQPIRQATPSPVAVTQIAPLAVAIATDPGSGALEVALSPDELGRLHMQVTTEGDILRIAMTVERPETLDLLRRHADQLLADLRQAGFGGAMLSFGQGSTGDGRTPGNAPDEVPVPQEPVRADPAPTYARRQSTANAPLDLRL